MNPTIANMDVEKHGGGLKMPVADKAAMANFKAKGFAPFIIRITSVHDGLSFIGLK